MKLYHEKLTKWLSLRLWRNSEIFENGIFIQLEMIRMNILERVRMIRTHYGKSKSNLKASRGSLWIFSFRKVFQQFQQLSVKYFAKRYPSISKKRFSLDYQKFLKKFSKFLFFIF